MNLQAIARMWSAMFGVMVSPHHVTNYLAATSIVEADDDVGETSQADGPDGPEAETKRP